MADRDTPSALLLDRYWDDVLAGNPEVAGGELDPVLAATVRRVHALDPRPTPSPRFAAHLWEDLVHTPSSALAAPTGFSTPSHLRLEPVANVPHHRFGGRTVVSLSRLAAAIIVFALISATVFAALYPLGVLDRDALTIFAPADNPPAEDDLIGTSLLSLTLTDLPPMRTFGGLTVADYPSGASSQERTYQGPQVLYIAIGPMTLTVTEAPDPVRVIAPGSAASSTADTRLGSGDEAELATGTTVIAETDAVIELANTGPEPTRMLSLIAPDKDSTGSTTRDGATWRWGSVGMPQELAPPVHIELRQITVNPSAALPIPPAEMGDYSAAVLDGNRIRDLSFAADLGWRNTSFAPIEAYLLRITSGPPEQG